MTAAAVGTRRWWVASSCFVAINLVAACAHKTRDIAQNEDVFSPVLDVWAGRISLKVQSDPPQAFFAGFELKGQPEMGELTLISPLGSILGVLRWTPSSATLESGQVVKRANTVDELLEQATGAAIPAAALFDWLAGKQTSISNWTADLSQRSVGRIVATRALPLPKVELRVILDR